MRKTPFWILILSLISIHSIAQSFDQLKHHLYIDEEIKIDHFIPNESMLHYQYKISADPYSTVLIGFKNYSSWEQLHLSSDSLKTLVQQTIQYYGDTLKNNNANNIFLSHVYDAKYWMMKREENIKPTIIGTNLLDKHGALKQDYDTLNIFIINKDKFIYYKIINNIVHIDDKFWIGLQEGIDSITASLQPIANSKNPDAFRHQIVGARYYNYKNDKATFEYENKTFINSINQNIVAEFAMGPYFGLNNISMNMDALVAYPVFKGYSTTLPYIGLNSGILNPKLSNNQFTSDQYVAVEIGAMKRKFNAAFFGNPRTSIALGIYNTGLSNGIMKDFFTDKPQFYLALKYPIWEHLQLTLHMSSNFKTKAVDYNKYLFGISAKFSLGSLIK